MEKNNYSLINIRLTGNDKLYYASQLQQYTDKIIAKFDNIKRVEFGKQDMRGAISITLFDNKNCVPQQRHFSTKKEMLGFIVGYNLAASNAEYI